MDASLFPAGDEQHRIWRAQLIHRADTMVDVDESGMPHRMDLVARRLVDQLVADGVMDPSYGAHRSNSPVPVGSRKTAQAASVAVR